MDELPFIPQGNKVYVKDDEVPSAYGAIVVPEVNQLRPMSGAVIALGPEFLTEEIEVGSRLVFGQYAGVIFRVDGLEVRVLDPYEILAFVKPGLELEAAS